MYILPKVRTKLVSVFVSLNNAKCIVASTYTNIPHKAYNVILHSVLTLPTESLG